MTVIQEHLFCFQPRQATLLIGVIGVVTWNILLLISLVFVVILNEQVQKERNAPKTAEDLQRRLLFDAAAYFIGYVMAIVVLVLSFINIMFSSLLIHGSLKYLKKFVLPWLIWNSLQIVSFCLLLIIAAKYGGFVEEPRLFILIPGFCSYGSFCNGGKNKNASFVNK